MELGCVTGYGPIYHQLDLVSSFPTKLQAGGVNELQSNMPNVGG
jgi:hypothetical protein